MHIELRPLTRDEWPLWDDFVEKAPRGTVFHSSYCQLHSRGKFVIYGCFKGGELHAGIPIVYREKFGIKIASRIGTPYSGIIFKKTDGKYVVRLAAEKELSRQIAQRLKSDFHVLVLGYAPGPVDLQPLIWEGFSTSLEYTYILQLNRSLEELWMGMEETTRTSVRRAEKDGVTVIPSDDFNQTIDMIQKTYRRQGMVLRSKAEYCSRNEVLVRRKQCKSFLARNAHGEYIAGVYIIWDNKRSYYLLGGYDSENGHYGASTLAMWEAIKYTKNDLGLAEFDFLGSMIPQVERFFRGFGGQLSVRHRVMWTKPYLKLALVVSDIFKSLFHFGK